MSDKKSFEQGYICAVACMLNGHGYQVEVPAREALVCIGFRRMNLRHIDKYDKEILKKYGFIPRTPNPKSK